MRIAVVAGEASGDLLGAGLIRAIRARCPEASFEGIAGPEMIAAGCEGLYPMERLSVMGLFEALGRYLELLPVRARLARRFIADPPDAFVGIDAPDFNLSLERRLRAAGIPTIHYVSPAVWAWRRYRIKKIARSVDLMLTLFPFEAEFYEQHGVPVRFVGHPLADLIPERVDRAAARAELGVAGNGEVVALLPGSRLSEVKYLAGPMVRTARWLDERRPGLRFLVPLVNEVVRGRFERELEGVSAGLDIVLLDGKSRSVMAAADAVLLASGTASLEAMLLKRPMVITYKATELTFRIMEYWIGLNVRFAGLPNLLAGRELVPELMQDKAVPELLGPPILDYLGRAEASRSLFEEFGRLHRVLRRGASDGAAEAVLETARGGAR